jgi:hypothetical protein
VASSEKLHQKWGTKPIPCQQTRNTRDKKISQEHHTFVRMIDMDIQKGAGLKLDPTKVPPELQHLIPYVERWGFESLDDQDAFVAEMQVQHPQEIEEFNTIVDKAKPLINAWGVSLAELNKPMNELSEEDWKHPYWSFLNMLKLREITGFDDQDDPGVIAANQRFAQEVRMQRYHEATVKADEAFRLQDYREYVSILSPYLDLFTISQTKKFELARRRMNNDGKRMK